MRWHRCSQRRYCLLAPFLATAILSAAGETGALPASSPWGSGGARFLVSTPSHAVSRARATMLRLRGGEEQRARASSGVEPVLESKVADGATFASKGSAKPPPKIDSSDAKEMLYQLTTQLFNPGRAGSNVDYYQLLEISRTATPKEIRDGYYRAAKKWHPDKNKQDPNAEARFKTISEAYEVLSLSLSLLRTRARARARSLSLSLSLSLAHLLTLARSPSHSPSRLLSHSP